MSLQKLINYIGSVNIAKDLSDERLHIIGQQVIERADYDLDSMKDWIECVKKGIELCKPEFNGKSTPWPNASNFKSNILTEAANSFGNRAAVEIMRDPNLVKADIIGMKTIKNVIDKRSSDIAKRKKEIEDIAAMLEQMSQAGTPPDEKATQLLQELQEKTKADEQVIKDKKEQLRKRNERADRVAEMMNWQVNVKMTEWRSQQKRLMYSLPNVGTLFKKTYFDPTLGRCVSKVIQFPDFIVNQHTECMKTCRSFTHVMAFTKSEHDIRVQQGLWVDCDLFKEAQTNEAGSNENSESEYTEDNPDKFYEQYCWIDLDEDGIEEPYIVTVHVMSGKVVRIVARYDEDCLIVKSENYTPMSLIDAQRKSAARIDALNSEYGTSEEYKAPDDLEGYELVRVEPIGIITKYGMIPSFDGTYLDVGFYHLIGATAMGVNKTTNDLLNAGTLANSQTGIVAKNFRKRPGNFSVKMGEFTQTELTAQDLQSGLMKLPYSEPSQTLFMLNEKMENSARSFSANVDNGGMIQSNTAPTTALAMIQESRIQHTAHMSMIVDSMSEEFQIIFALNRDYVDDAEYKEVVGDDEAVFSDDFNTDGLSISCGANPEMSSRMQRMMLAEAEMAQMPYVIQAGGNAVAVLKNYYNAIGSPNTHEYFPNEAEMSPEEKAQMQQMQQMQQATLEAQQQQTQMIQLQTEILQKEQERKDAEAQVNAQKTIAQIDELRQKIDNMQADKILTLEKAETEQVNNQINTYTAVSEETSRLEALIQEKMNE
jgi:chaperonin GroES